MEKSTEGEVTEGEFTMVKPVKRGKTMGDALVYLFEVCTLILILFTWFGGFSLAKGFWQSLFALFPLYSWYLLAAHYVGLPSCM